MASYGDGRYAAAPPPGNGLVITDLFHMVEPKADDPGIRSTIDTQYPNVAIITFDAANQFGGMWAKERLDLTLPFSTEMYLYLAREDGKSGTVGDGMTFTLQNDPAGLNAIAGAGEGLGAYRGRRGTIPHGRHLQNSLVIEFDTYGNDEDDGIMQDPQGGAHCALLLPRADRITPNDHLNVRHFTVGQKQWVKFTANWTPNDIGGGTLTYNFDNYTHTYDVANIVQTFGDTMVYWGFTGSTGEWMSVQAAAITRLPDQGVTVEKGVTNSSGADINYRYALPGDVLTYTIRVTALPLAEQIGPVLIEDVLSDFTEYAGGDVQVTTDNGNNFPVTPTITGQTITIDTARYLAAENEWIEVTFNVNVLPNTEGEVVTNQAKVTAVGLPEEHQSNITNVTIYGNPEKTVSQQSPAGSSGSPVKVGDLIIYEITYANYSGARTTVTITDTLPTEVDFVSAGNGGTYDEATRTVTWTLPDVDTDVWGTVSLTVRVNASAVTRIENYAFVTVNMGPQQTNIVTNDVESVNPGKAVADDSAAGQNGAAVRKGDAITYEIGYENFSDAPAEIIIVDHLPVGVDFDHANEGGVYAPDTHTVTWTLADVPSAARGTVRLVAIVNEKATVRIINYATVKVGDNDPRFTNIVINPLVGSYCLDYQISNKCRTNINGQLVWDDESNLDNTRPPAVDIILLRNGELYKSISIDATADTSNFSFTCLPLNINTTSSYSYQLDEAVVPEGYIKSIDGNIITNTLGNY